MDENARFTREKEIHNDQGYCQRRQSKYGDFYSKPIIRPRDQKFWEELSEIENKKALDYGCGIGSVSKGLARRGADVTGIDISDVRIEQAKINAKNEGLNITFICGNAERLDIPSGTFDIVCGGAILHHLNLENALRDISRILKKGGKAVFVEPLAINPLIKLFRFLTPSDRSIDEHPFTMRDLERIKQSFSRIRFDFFIFFPLICLLTKKVFKVHPEFLLRFTQFLDRKILNKTSLKYFAWQVLIVMEK